MASLKNLFFGNPVWQRPTHEANRLAITAGQAKCQCIPSTSTRVVVEMWGQGGGGSPGRCTSWGCVGGQGGAYAYKVWSGSISPASVGTNFTFCGCVCACDCRTCCSMLGHCGRFARLCNCNSTGGTGVGSWLGCACGGTGGQQGFCANVSWVCHPCGCGWNQCYDTGCISFCKGGSEMYYQITNMSTAQNSTCLGGSCSCCVGASCYCAENLCSATCTTTNGFKHTTDSLLVGTPTVCAARDLDDIFPIISCTCFDMYRQGACGWTKTRPYLFTQANDNARFCGTWNYCDIGVGGASYGGGAQQKLNGSMGNYAYCGHAGNFPGGGGKSSGACGGPCCLGSIGGGGLILISWS